MGYSKMISNYPERIVLFDPTHLTSIADLGAIGMGTLKIDSAYSLEKLIDRCESLNDIIPNY